MKHASTAVEDWKIRVREVEEMLSTMHGTDREEVQVLLDEIKEELAATEEKLHAVSPNIEAEEQLIVTREQKKHIEPLLESLKQHFKELRNNFGHLIQE